MIQNFNNKKCLTLTISNKCPLSCSHCGPESGPKKQTVIDQDSSKKIINNAKSLFFGIINFSGGEPFLFPNDLRELIEYSSQLGFITRTATSAYWANSYESAVEKLKPLAKAGLKELFISCGDDHQSIVPFENVIYATKAARAYNISPFIALSCSLKHKITLKYVCKTFEINSEVAPWILESPVIPFGRASVSYEKSDLITQPSKNFSGGCPSLSINPTVFEDGTLAGCAVVFARDCNSLCFGNVTNDSFEAILTKMKNHPLVSWIHNIGVVALKELIERQSSIKFSDKHVNICHLCGEILNNKDALIVLAKLGLIR